MEAWYKTRDRAHGMASLKNEEPQVIAEMAALLAGSIMPATDAWIPHIADSLEQKEWSKFLLDCNHMYQRMEGHLKDIGQDALLIGAKLKANSSKYTLLERMLTNCTQWSVPN